MELIEREHQLQSLADAWAQAVTKRGRIALVSGEAGIGKTSLIERFVADRGRATRVLRGGCDALFSPQPLGSFIEIAAQTGQADLEHLVQSGGDRLAFSAAFFLHLQKQPAPTLVILEDLHWADEATLDVVKYLGRRVQHVPVLLILSYRDDEVSGDHTLRSLLGDLPAPATVRLALPQLSPAAVEQMARQVERRPEGLYRVTGGNPFFVTEVLASQAEGIPSVRDAVLARCARLSPAARGVVELAALVPGSAEGWLIADLLRPDPAVVDECIARGILHPVGQSAARRNLAFRHELARQSVEDSVPISRARALHGRILAALLPLAGPGVPLARLVHHAVRAGDDETTLRLAPQAARQASALGAHREAAGLYTTLLRYHSRMTPQTEAEVLEALSVENYLIDRIEDAIQTRQQAIAIWQRLERDERVGDGHRWLSRLHWMAGHGQAAKQHADRAIAILSVRPPGPELAMAYSARSQLHMLAWEVEPALEWGNRAIALAEKLGAVEILVHAMTNVGSIETLRDKQTGNTQIEHALRLALDHEMHDHVGRCYSNLTSNAIRERDYAAGRQYATEGIAYCAARDLDTYTNYLLGWRAQLELDTGHWAAAEADALEAMRLSQEPTISLIPALVSLSRLKARQGDPAAEKLLDDVLALARPTGELQRLGPAAAARAEAAWLRGQAEHIAAEADLGYALAISLDDAWVAGDVAYWAWRGDRRDVPLKRLARPFADMIRGDWAAAAEQWAQIGCPFEQALALMDGDEAAQLRALALFTALGAEPAAALVRHRLNLEPPATTRRAHPDDLTPRELEVLRLLAAGLSNPAIAARLTISVGTVKAHTANIYGKLGVANRVQAVSRAQELRLL